MSDLSPTGSCCLVRGAGLRKVTTDEAFRFFATVPAFWAPRSRQAMGKNLATGKDHVSPVPRLKVSDGGC